MKHCKLIILLILILPVSLNSYAQKKKDFKEIVLKNGDIITGYITENNTDSILTIKTKKDKIYVINKNEVKEIVSANPRKSNSIVKDREPVTMTIDIGFIGFGGYYLTGTAGGLLIKGSYRFKDQLYAGITGGIEYFDMPLLPLNGELQADLFKRNVTPFVYARAGYSFALLPKETGEVPTSYKGGLTAGSGLGIKFYRSKQFAWYFSLGYRHQRTEKTNLYEDYYGRVDRAIRYNRVSFRFGFIF